MGFRRFYKSYFLHETLKFLTVCWSMGFTLLIVCMWWLAFFTGDEVVITINHYNEKWLEMVLGFVLIPTMLYGFYWFIRDYAAKKRRLRKSMRWFMSLDRKETL
jgi:hypothetical protein